MSYDNALTWVMDSMPTEAQQALETFTRLNPHWRGAYWDDCLDVLLDSDSHLDVTEPLHDDEVLDTMGALPGAVAITCLYASKFFAEQDAEHQRLIVRLTIQTNGQFLEALGALGAESLEGDRNA